MSQLRLVAQREVFAIESMASYPYSVQLSQLVYNKRFLAG